MAKRVFFLGAGFSKAIKRKYPLMKDLTENVKKQIDDEELFEHYNKIAPLIQNNIESLLTYLLTDFPWKKDNTKYLNRALYAAIIEKISNEFEGLTKKYKKTENTIWCEFASFVKKNWKECNFITLNYDILLETLLVKQFIKKEDDKYALFKGFYRYPISYIGDRDDSVFVGEGVYNIPSILKLHGSANWFWAGISPSDVLYYRLWGKYESEAALQGLKPYIIPPVMDKNAFYNHIAIRSLWQQAETLLKEADEIYIIGFSFPQTDLSVKYLFQSALKDSKADIYVVNADKWDNLKKNYNEVFGENRVDTTYTSHKKVSEKNCKQEYFFDPSVTRHFIKKHLLLQKEASK